MKIEEIQETQSWVSSWSGKTVTDAEAEKIIRASRMGYESLEKVIRVLGDAGITIPLVDRYRFSSEILPGLFRALERVRETSHAALVKTAGLEFPDGPGFPFKSFTYDPEIPATAAQMQETIANDINLHGLYNYCRKLSGDFEPPRMALELHLTNEKDPDATQGDLSAEFAYRLGDDPQTKRLLFLPEVMNCLSKLSLNYAFVKHDPEEAKGMIIHELGHLWTQRILATHSGRTEPIHEAFAELFRSLAAIRSGARWEQAHGCSGYQVLYGDPEPKLLHAHPECRLDMDAFHASRYLASNRLVHHLGGIDEQKLRGIGEACVVNSYPHNMEPLETVLRDIEKKTGVQKFADNFLADPMLKAGNLQKGLTAIAFPNVAGNSCQISCFEIMDTAPLFMQSRKTYANPRQGRAGFNNKDLFMESPKIRHPQFTATLAHASGKIGLVMEANGQLNLSPRKVIELGAKKNISWPEGDYNVTFALKGQKPIQVQQTMNISRQEREFWCARYNIPVIG